MADQRSNDVASKVLYKLPLNFDGYRAVDKLFALKLSLPSIRNNAAVGQQHDPPKLQPGRRRPAATKLILHAQLAAAGRIATSKLVVPLGGSGHTTCPPFALPSSIYKLSTYAPFSVCTSSCTTPKIILPSVTGRTFSPPLALGGGASAIVSPAWRTLSVVRSPTRRFQARIGSAEALLWAPNNKSNCEHEVMR